MKHRVDAERMVVQEDHTADTEAGQGGPTPYDIASRIGDIRAVDKWRNMFSGSKTMQAWRLWHLFQSRVVEGCDASLKQNTRVDLVDLYILVALHDAPDQQMRMSDLAGAVGFSPPRMTYRVNKLVQRGFVTRETQTGDARSQLVQITAEGAEEMASAYKLHDFQIGEIFGKVFSDEELDNLSMVAASLLTLRMP